MHILLSDLTLSILLLFGKLCCWTICGESTKVKVSFICEREGIPVMERPNCNAVFYYLGEKKTEEGSCKVQNCEFLIDKKYKTCYDDINRY